MTSRKGRAGTHSSTIGVAEPLVAALEKLGRVSRGVIYANAGASGRAIKVLPLDAGLRVTVVAKSSRQEFHVYGVSVDQIRELLSGREYRSFVLNLPDAG